VSGSSLVPFVDPPPLPRRLLACEHEGHLATPAPYDGWTGERRPFTTVNGKVRPVLEVEPSTYRLRVLNGANARTFRT
jgi:FtsP/CotA-like multicopper oxidase with cupredoxin domain